MLCAHTVHAAFEVSDFSVDQDISRCTTSRCSAVFETYFAGYWQVNLLETVSQKHQGKAIIFYFFFQKGEQPVALRSYLIFRASSSV